LQYVAGILKPNVPNLVPGTSAYVRNNYISTGTTVSPSDRYSFKVDETLSSKHHISFLHNRYNDQLAFGANGPVGLPVPLSGALGYNRAHVYRGSWDYTISPTFLNRFYGGFNDWREDHGSPGTVTGTAMSAGLATISKGWKEQGMCIPNVDKFLQPVSFFGTQPTDAFGNVTRYNPKLRSMPNFSENVSLARTVGIKEALRLEMRGEAFNLLNRTTFGALSGGTSLQNANFGLWRTQSNSARRMQVALKLYW
jgi:hypothetical protein